MALSHATATNHLDLHAKLRTFVKTGLGSGANWTELRYDAGAVRSLFQAPGLSGDQEINIGMSAHGDVGSDTYAIGFFMFKSYVSALPDLEQPGISPVCYHTVWDDAIPFWAVANAQRIMVVTKVSTVYPSAHAGKILPGGTPGQYPQPYYVAASVLSPLTRWSSASPNTRSFFDPGEAGFILRPDGAWWPMSNFFDSTGEQPQSNSNFIWPYASVPDGGAQIARYQELRENIDGTYPLRPLILHGNKPSLETFGEIDGAYALPGFATASEDTITIAGQAYLVTQCQFRTNRFNYAAIKLL